MEICEEPCLDGHATVSTEQSVGCLWLTELSNATFVGSVWFIALFQLPQRYQIVHNSSAMAAGLHILPFTASAPLGAILGTFIAKKGVPPIYMILFTSITQAIGFILLSTIGSSNGISRAAYGYQTLAGFGCGANNALISLLTPFSVEFQDIGMH